VTNREIASEQYSAADVDRAITNATYAFEAAKQMLGLGTKVTSFRHEQ